MIAKPDIHHEEISVLLNHAAALTPTVLLKYENSACKDFRRLLPQLTQGQLQTIVPEFIRNSLRNMVIRNLQQAGRMREEAGIVHCHNEDELLELRRRKQPVILMFAHLGPPLAVISGLFRLGLSATGIRNFGGRPHDFPGIDIWETKPGSLQTRLFPKKAISDLQAGGMVLLGIDGRLGETQITHPCLGRLMTFMKGIFIIQQLSRATVIPAHACWRVDGDIDCNFGTPLTQNGDLHPGHVASWLENRILEDPSQLRVKRLHEFLALPLVDCG